MKKNVATAPMKKFFATAWTLVIVALCSIPGNNLPDVDFFSADKLGHFTMFAVFAWLWAWALDARRAILYVVAGGVFFAIGTEFYQGILPFDREPSALDTVANLVGLATGLWLSTGRRNAAASGSHTASREPAK